MRLVVVFVLGVILGGCFGHSVATVGDLAPGGNIFRTPVYHSQLRGELKNHAITEASGLAASRRYTNRLWALNDGGNAAVLYAIGSDGSNMGKLQISGARNRDWEDLASFEWEGESYLLIADIGDNQAKRDRYALYLVHEPEMPGTRSVPVKRTIKFVYEDGPRDAEALAVDVQEKRIFILTKRDNPPLLYELPLFPNTGGVQVARRVTSIMSLPQPSLADIFANPVLGKLGDVPTAMDILPDGSAAIVMTYRSVLLYKRHSGMSWDDVFSRPPTEIANHSLMQGEALTFGRDGEQIYYTSEHLPAPLWQLTPVK